MCSASTPVCQCNASEARKHYVHTLMRQPQPRSSTAFAGLAPSARRWALIGWASSTRRSSKLNSLTTAAVCAACGGVRRLSECVSCVGRCVLGPQHAAQLETQRVDHGSGVRGLMRQHEIGMRFQTRASACGHSGGQLSMLAIIKDSATCRCRTPDSPQGFRPGAAPPGAAGCLSGGRCLRVCVYCALCVLCLCKFMCFL